ADQTVHVNETTSIAHQTAGGSKFILEDSGDCVAKCQLGELLRPAGKEGIGADRESSCPQRAEVDKSRIEIAFATGLQKMKPPPEGRSRTLAVSRKGLGLAGLGRIDKKANSWCRGQGRVQQCHPLHHVIDAL